MPNFSDKPFRIAYFVDTFPRLTENFILREIAGVLEFWPDLRVYCFHATPENWGLVDCGDSLSKVPSASIALSFPKVLLLHLKWMFRNPFSYWRGIWETVRVHGYLHLRALRRFEQALRLAEMARRDGIEHLHAHFISEPATICHLAAKMLGISYSISAHAHDIWVQRPLQKVIEEATVCVVCTAQGCDHLTQQYPAVRVHLVRHGLSMPSALETPRPLPPPLRIVTGGRLVPKKGFDVLIDACMLLMQRGIDFQCDIYGEGELELELRQQITQGEVENKVRLHAFLPHEEFRSCLAQAHLCVMPCRVDAQSGDRDGIPNIVLEAASVGTLLVASDLPSLHEFVQDGVTGFLCEPDNTNRLADSIEKSLHKINDWPTLRANAKQLLREEFDPETNVSRLKTIIEESHI